VPGCLVHEYFFQRPLEIGAQATELSALSTALGRRRAVLMRETEHYGETHCNEVDLLYIYLFYFILVVRGIILGTQDMINKNSKFYQDHGFGYLRFNAPATRKKKKKMFVYSQTIYLNTKKNQSLSAKNGMQILSN
jgi:hypothetical protein